MRGDLDGGLIPMTATSPMLKISVNIVHLLLLIALPASADPTAAADPDRDCRIEGTVTDPHGHPLAGAIVEVVETGLTVTTDEDGFYCIENAASGYYNLMISSADYVHQHVETVQVSAGATGVVKIRLMPQYRQEIVVTGTRSEKRLSEAPVRTELINRDAIEFSGSRTLADAVEFTTGVRVENDCQNCNFSQIRLLGLDGAYSQILVDSQPVLSSLAAVYGVEHIPARMIDRIEVVKGGGSAIYGPGSVAGVINVIPRTPVEDGGSAQASYQGIDGEPGYNLDAAVDVVTDDGKTAVTLFGQLDQRDAVDVNRDGFSDVTERTIESFGARFGRFALDGDARISVDCSHTFEDRRGGDNLDLPEFMAEIAESIQSKRDAASVSWMHVPSRRFDYRLNISYAYTDRDTYYGGGMDPNAYGSSTNPLFVLESQCSHHLGDHDVAWGMQFTSDGLNDEQPAYDRFIDETYTNTGVFLQDDWRMGQHWELVAGARVDDHSEVDGLIASPRLALKWDPIDEFTARASLATGFRAPQIFDEDLHIIQVGGEGQIIRNNPDLKEESSRTCTLGVEWTPTFGAGNGLVEANVFNTDIDDLFFISEDDDPATDEREFTRINLGGARVAGAEFNLGCGIGNRFVAEAGFVVQSARSDEPHPDFGVREFYRTPEKYGVLSLQWKSPRFVDLFVGAKYTGPMKVPHYAGYIEEDVLETTDSFLTFDTSVARAIPLARGSHTALVVTLGAKNITNEYQKDLDLGADRDAGYVYGPRFPRTFYTSVKFEF
jgi:outer membrane receptor for ferrienterochelin and colicins